MEVYQVLDKNEKFVGKVDFELDVLLSDHLQHKYIEKVLNEKQIHRGSIKFFTIADEKGSHVFIEPPSPLKPNNLNLKSPGLFVRKSEGKDFTLSKRTSKVESDNPENDLHQSKEEK